MKIAVLAAGTAVVCACSGGGGGMAGVDTRMTTSSVPTSLPEDLRSDGQAMLSALSEGAQPGAFSSLSWENPESGARGLITAFSEEEGRTECLAFTTTRQNFEGIALYQGTACENAAGGLRLQRLESL